MLNCALKKNDLERFYIDISSCSYFTGGRDIWSVSQKRLIPKDVCPAN